MIKLIVLLYPLADKRPRKSPKVYNEHLAEMDGNDSKHGEMIKYSK